MFHFLMQCWANYFGYYFYNKAVCDRQIEKIDGHTCWEDWDHLADLFDGTRKEE